MPNFEIGGVFSDVDRTLVNEHQLLPSEIDQAAARNLRVPLMLATGRSWPLVQNLITPLALRSACVLDNGATIIQAPGGERMRSSWLDAKTVTQIARGIGHRATLLSCEAEYKPFDPRKVDMDAYTLTEASPSTFANVPVSEEDALDEMLRGIPDITYRFMRSGTSEEFKSLQVTRAGVDKGSGVRDVIDLAQLRDTRFLVIDDDLKGGLPLFEAAGEHGIKVAMGNAPDELKDRADWVAPSIEENGFAAAMERYGLISS